MKVYPFVKNADEKYKRTRETCGYDPKEIVESRTHSQYFFITMHGVCKCMGWAYDFRDELHRYIVKDGQGQLFEMYAPNKTSLRKGFGSRIDYIVEVPNKFFKN